MLAYVQVLCVFFDDKHTLTVGFLLLIRSHRGGRIGVRQSLTGAAIKYGNGIVESVGRSGGLVRTIKRVWDID